MGRITSTVRTLQERNRKLVDERDEARKDHASAVWVNSRLANKIQEDADAAGWELARLQELLDTTSEMRERAQVRAERLVRTILKLRDQNTAKDETIRDLRDRLSAWEGGDRAVMLPPQPGTNLAAQVAELKRQVADKNSQLLALDAQMAILEKANQKDDWQLAVRSGAVEDQPTPLAQAS